jgi:hypothetical protein
MGPLSANRQAAAVTQAAITTDIHQPFDVHLDTLSQVALDVTLGIEYRAQLVQIVFADVLILASMLMPA